MTTGQPVRVATGYTQQEIVPTTGRLHQSRKGGVLRTGVTWVEAGSLLLSWGWSSVRTPPRRETHMDKQVPWLWLLVMMSAFVALVLVLSCVR